MHDRPDRPSYDPVHFETLFAAGERHFWFRHRNALLAAVVRREARRLGGIVRLLEVGCGAGNVLAGLERLVPAVTLLGLDLHLERLACARRHARCGLVQGDVRRPPFAAATRFELVGLFDVLEHLDDDGEALRALLPLVAPQGRLLLTVPAGPQLWSVVDEQAGHRRRYRAEPLRALLASAGFEVEYLTPFMAPLYPLVRLARAVASRRRDDQAVASELRVVPGFNELCAALLWPERLPVARRWRLPWGSSLLAVARVAAGAPPSA
jgi:SAM-dependent methyltransferase